MSTKATDKQVNYALKLLKQKGFSTTWMNKDFKRLGASMRDRSGLVEDWLKNMSRTDISSVIDTLKGMGDK